MKILNSPKTLYALLLVPVIYFLVNILVGYAQTIYVFSDKRRAADDIYVDYQEKHMGIDFKAPKGYTVLLSKDLPYDFTTGYRYAIISNMKLNKNNRPKESEILYKVPLEKPSQGIGGYYVDKGLYIKISYFYLDPLEVDQMRSREVSYKKNIGKIDGADLYYYEKKLTKYGYTGLITIYTIVGKDRTYDIHASYPVTKYYSETVNNIISSIKFTDNVDIQAY